MGNNQLTLLMFAIGFVMSMAVGFKFGGIWYNPKSYQNYNEMVSCNDKKSYRGYMSDGLDAEVYGIKKDTCLPFQSPFEGGINTAIYAGCNKVLFMLPSGDRWGLYEIERDRWRVISDSKARAYILDSNIIIR